MHAALVIDMQEYYLCNAKEPYKIIRNQNEVLEKCYSREIPIAVIESAIHDPTVKELTLPPGSRVRRFRKHENDAFNGTTLSSWLESFGVKDITLMGVNFPYCVLDSAKGAHSRDFRVSTALDIVSCFRGVTNEEIKAGLWFTLNGKLRLKYTSLPIYKN